MRGASKMTWSTGSRVADRVDQVLAHPAVRVVQPDRAALAALGDHPAGPSGEVLLHLGEPAIGDDGDVVVLGPGLREHHEVGGQAADQLGLLAGRQALEAVRDLDRLDADVLRPAAQPGQPALGDRDLEQRAPEGEGHTRRVAQGDPLLDARVDVGDPPADLEHVHQVADLRQQGVERGGRHALVEHMGEAALARLPLARGQIEEVGTVPHVQTLRSS